MATPNPIAPFLSKSAYRLNVVEQFGAQGDGVTDDWLAIQTAVNFSSVYNVPVYLPPATFSGKRAVYKLLRPLAVNPGVSLLGDATAPTFGPVLQAGVAMTSLLTVGSISASGTPGAQPTRIVGLTFDGMNLATDTARRQGDFLSRYERCTFRGGLRNAMRAVAHTTGLTLSSVTVGGGGAAGALTVTQPDVTYNGFTQIPSASIVHRIVTPGVLGTATFQTSQDGGVSYSTGVQTLYPSVTYCRTQQANPNQLFVQDSGLQLTWAARSYAANETYAYTITDPVELGGLVTTINADARFHDCWWESSGQVFGTALYQSTFSGYVPVQVAHGTVALTSGSQVVTLTGDDLTRMGGIRPGDVLLTNGTIYPIASILDPTHLVTYPGASSPFVTLSGLDYAICVGYGYREDPETELIRSVIDTGRFRNVPGGLLLQGTQGPTIIQPRIELYSHSALMLGGPLVGPAATALVRPHVEAGEPGSTACYLASSSTGSTAIEPPELWPAGGTGAITGPGPHTYTINGITYSHNGTTYEMVPKYTLQLVRQDQTITSNAFQFPAPVGERPLTGGTLWRVQATAPVTLTSAQPVVSGGQEGMMVMVYNFGGSSITWPHAGNNLDIGGADIVQGQFQTMTFVVLNARYALVKPA